MANIFWVEDQTHWIDKFREALAHAEFDDRKNVITVCKFTQAAKQKIAQMGESNAPDIAILDANMNGNDEAGFAVSRALRKKWPNLPIVYLSEFSGTDIERDALELNAATDFIAKHQRNIEDVLCWRIRAALRQASVNHAQTSDEVDGTLVSGQLRIDLDSWHVYWRGVRLMNPKNPKRPLAPTPRKILRFLVEESPRPLSTGQIADKLGDAGERFSYSTYRQHIKVLRQSIGQAQDDQQGFLELCKSGSGVVTFGDAQAYLWKAPVDE